jgi:hypothetical protein
MAIKGTHGYGYTSVLANPITTQQATIPSIISTFNMTNNRTFQEAKGYPVGGNGKMQIIFKYNTEDNWTVSTGIQALDFGGLQLLLGEFEETTASIKHREGYAGTVPGSPYEITDAALTGLAVADVTVSVAYTGTIAYQPLKVITGTPSTGEVKLDSTNGKLVFNSAQAGLPILYYILNTYSSVQTIGVEQSAVLLDQVSFDGVLDMASAPNRIRFNMPSLGPSGNTTIQVGDNTVEFTALAYGSNRSPIRWIKG